MIDDLVEKDADEVLTREAHRQLPRKNVCMYVHTYKRKGRSPVMHHGNPKGRSKARRCVSRKLGSTRGGQRSLQNVSIHPRKKKDK